MASEFQIYLRDELVNTNNNVVKRQISEIQDILNDITPNTTITKTNPTNQGFIVSYNNDSDINFIFNSNNIRTLKDKHLSAELSSTTQAHRQVVISGLSNDIHSKSLTEIQIEIQQKNSINILLLSKYESQFNHKRYLFITLDSKVVKDQTIEKGTINIFEKHFSVHKSHSKPRATTSRPHLAPLSQGTPGAQQQAHTRAQWQGQSLYPNFGTHSSQHQGQTRSQWQGQVLPPNPNWSCQRNSYNLISPVNTSTSPPPWSASGHQQSQGPPTRPSSTWTQPTQFSATSESSDFDIKLLVEARSKICEVLSYGMENPEAYVNLMNHSFSQQGLPSINIPASALADARELFLLKTTTDPSSFHTKTNPHLATNTAHLPSPTSTNLSVQSPYLQPPVSPTPFPVSSTSPPVSSISSPVSPATSPVSPISSPVSPISSPVSNTSSPTFLPDPILTPSTTTSPDTINTSSTTLALSSIITPTHSTFRSIFTTRSPASQLSISLPNSTSSTYNIVNTPLHSKHSISTDSLPTNLYSLNTSTPKFFTPTRRTHIPLYISSPMIPNSSFHNNSTITN